MKKYIVKSYVMKKCFKLILLFFVLVFTLTVAHGQTTYKQAEKMLKGKAVKDARKEAKKWRKQGYENLPGDIPLDHQFEVSMIKQLILDEDGNARYIVAFGTALAGTESVASANALNNAIIALATQISSEVSALVSNNKANTQYNTEEVETIDEFISNSKTLIQKEIGQIKPAIRMARKTVNKNVEYRYTVVYDLKNAKKIAKRVIKEGLKEQLNDNEEDLDTLLGL